MQDFPRAMKLSLCFGAAGAVITPFMYECYANVSRAVALILLAVWAVSVGVKCSALTRRSALLSVTAELVYTFGLGIICYIIIHNAAVSLLEKSSKYFYLNIREQLLFWLYAFLIHLVSFIVMFFIWGIKYAVKHIKRNNERAAGYIENAFSDDSGDGL